VNLHASESEARGAALGKLRLRRPAISWGDTLTVRIETVWASAIGYRLSASGRRRSMKVRLRLAVAAVTAVAAMIATLLSIDRSGRHAEGAERLIAIAGARSAARSDDRPGHCTGSRGTESGD
jgi:hypothetical protein